MTLRERKQMTRPRLPGRPAPDVSAKRRAYAVAALQRDPGLSAADLGAQLGIRPQSAASLLARLRAAGEAPPPPPTPVREPTATFRARPTDVARLVALTGAGSSIDAVALAVDLLSDRVVAGAQKKNDRP